MAEDPAVLRQRAAEMLADAEQSLVELTQMRAERERASPAPEPPKPVARIPEPPEMSTRHMSNWDATQTWVEKIIDQRTGAAAKSWTIKQLEDVTVALAHEAGNLMAELRSQLRGEIKTTIDALRDENKTALGELRTEFDRRLVEAEHRAEVAALERRLAEAEQRAAPKSAVRLIGHSDAAD